MQAVLRFFRGVNPLGPIFTKELRSTARRKRTYVLRFLYLGVLLLCLLFFHLATSSFEDAFRYGSVAARAQHNAELGLIFFGIFSFFSLGMMGLIGPVLTCTAVNSERLHKTLPVLLMTPITSWQILGGKLFSRLLIAFTLLGLSLPALAVVRLLGGVEVEQIVASLSISITTVIFTASVGLFFSTLMNRAYAVVILSYGLCALLWGILPAVVGMIYAAVNPRGGPPRGLLEFLSVMPWFSMAINVIPEGFPFRIAPWYWGCLLHLGMAFALLLWSGLILRRMARKDASGGPAPVAPQYVPPPPPLPVVAETPDASGPSVAAPAPPPPMLAYAPPKIRNAAVARDVGDDPVLWREVRRPLVGKRWQKVLSVVIVCGLLLLFYILLASIDDYRAGSAIKAADSQVGFAFVFCGLFTVLTCIISATAIATEKESDTWTLLLATPLSSAQIVRGKLVGILRRLMWPAILIAAHFLLFTVTGVIHPGAFAVVILLTFGTNMLFAVTGLHLSLRLKTVTIAVILNLLVPITLYLIVWLVWGICCFLAAARGGDNLAEAPGLLSPYGYMYEAIDKLDDSRWQYHERQAARSGVVSNYVRPGPWLPTFGVVTWRKFALGVVLVIAGHLAVAWLILSATLRSFNRIVGRASQTTPHPPPMAAALRAT
jgi:ABC-type transport system involved in multi-copper enzyme maturation permease subunit